MGFVKKAAVMGAVAALAVNREKVKKAVRGLIGDGNDAMHGLADKVDDLATRADAALTTEVKATKAKVKRVAKKVSAKKPPARRKARHAARAN